MHFFTPLGSLFPLSPFLFLCIPHLDIVWWGFSLSTRTVACTFLSSFIMSFTWIASLCRPQGHWVHPLAFISLSKCSARPPVYFLGFHLVNSSLKSYSWQDRASITPKVSWPALFSTKVWPDTDVLFTDQPFHSWWCSEQHHYASIPEASTATPWYWVQFHWLLY